jgi:Domain of unknown function (DUF4442)
MNPQFAAFAAQMKSPLKFRLFMLSKLPSAFFAGLRVHDLTPQQSVIQVREKWFNKNPFRSMYFAILSMAAEVCTGALCWGAIYKTNPAISMLLVKMDGEFFKKANGTILFTCANGKEIQDAVATALATNEGVVVNCHATGTNQAGEIVAAFNFTWSFKTRIK